MKCTNIGLFTLMVALGFCNHAVGMKRFADALDFATADKSFTEEENQLAAAIAGTLLVAFDLDDIASPVKRQSHHFARYCSLAQTLVDQAVDSVAVKCKDGTRTVKIKQATKVLTADQPNGSGQVIIELTTYPFEDLVQPLDLDDEDAIEEVEEQEATILRLKNLGRKMPMLPASNGKYMFSIKLYITNWPNLTALNFLCHPIFEEMGVDRLLKDLLVSVSYKEKAKSQKNITISSEQPFIEEFDNTHHVKPVVNEETGLLVAFPNLSLLADEEHPHLQFLVDPYVDYSATWVPHNRKDAITCIWEENAQRPEEFRDTTGQLWVYNAHGEKGPGYYKADNFDINFDPKVTSSTESALLSPKLPGQRVQFDTLPAKPPTAPNSAHQRQKFTEQCPQQPEIPEQK